MDDTTTGLSTVVLNDEYSMEVVEIHTSIRDAKARIEANLRGLEKEVVQRLDVADWIRKHPGKSVGLAFAMGLYVGLK